jgi:hypothetical protein
MLLGERVDYAITRKGTCHITSAGEALTFHTFLDGHRENVIADLILAGAQEERWVGVEAPPLERVELIMRVQP